MALPGLPDSAHKKHRILRDDRQFAAQILQTNSHDVYSIYQDGSCCWLYQPEQSHT